MSNRFEAESRPQVVVRGKRHMPIHEFTDRSPTLAPDGTAIATRVRELLSGLSPHERVAMLHQVSPAVERLGLAEFHTGAEVLHGVAWLGTATLFPQPVGLAATWHPDLLRRIGEVVGVELRAKQAADPTVSRNVWAPVVNPLRHPRWGRNEEGYSEDPHLTADLATGYAAGLRGDHPDVWRTVPTLKHFLAYNNETDRAVTSSQLRPRVLHEYELPAFRGPVEAGVVGAVMPSYNLVNGRPNHVGAELIVELRSWTESDLLLVSDAGAPTNLSTSERYYPDPVEAHAASLLAGVDSFTDNGPDAGPTIALVTKALERRLLTMDDVDRAVARVLTVRLLTGELDPDDDPFAGISATDLDLPAHRLLAREAASRGVVLLRNDGVLPLTASGSIAVIGPLADRVLPDWYSGTPPYTVSLADAVRDRWPGSEVEVVDGSDRVTLRSSSTGLFVRGDKSSVLLADGASGSAQWDVTDWGTGVLTIASASDGKLWRARPDGAVLADSERPQGWVVQESFRSHRHHDGTWSLQHIGSGRWLRVEAHGAAVMACAHGAEEAERFVLRVVRSGAAEAARAAGAAATVLCALGNDPHLLGRETEDRPGLDLPAPAAELWRAVAEANPNSVLVLISSYPYALDAAAREAAAIVWSSHGGQELGNGLLDVLLGDVEPSGRLPQTWWRSDADAGDLLDYDILSSRTTYWYSGAEPLFAFGHGLTYSSIEYTGLDLDVAPDDHGVEATVTLRNTGTREATEVVQVYTDAPGHRLPFPHRLAAYRRVVLGAGETATVTLALPQERFAVWDVVTSAMVVEPGTYVVSAGPNAAETPLAGSVELDGVRPQPRDLPLRAIDFDESEDTRIEERTLERGDAVAVAPGSTAGRLVFRDVALPAGPLRVEVARSGPGPARIRLEQREGGRWTALGCVDLPVGGARHEFVALTLEPARSTPGPAHLRVILQGPVRFAVLRTGGGA